MSAGLRRRVVAYIGLGANLENPVAQVRAARRELQQHPELKEVGFSGLYRSTPLGPEDQPDYVNAAMAVETSLSPTELLAVLQQIEAAHDRTRDRDRWGPRTLDLDLLLYGSETIALPGLTVPHPEIEAREFVLIPLLAIARDLALPDGRLFSDLLAQCPRRAFPLIRLEEPDA